jgi:hypothetical protein
MEVLRQNWLSLKYIRDFHYKLLEDQKKNGGNLNNLITRESLFIKDVNKSSSENDNSSTSGDKYNARRSISNQNMIVQDELSKLFVS